MDCFKCNLVADGEKNVFFCDSCERVLHRECSGLSPTEIRVMDLKGKRMLKFFCSECQEGLSRVPKMYKIIDKLQSDIESFKCQLDKVSQKNGNHNNDSDNSEAMYSEIADRIDRASNIIVYNVPESSSSDLQQRIIHDKSHTSDILKNLDVNASSFKSIRLGRLGNRPRPIKVIFNEASLASQCLKRKKNLQSDHNIRLGADQTVMQRDYIKKIYKDLDERKAKGEKNLIVKFIRGIPKIVVNTRNNTNIQTPKN